MTKTAIITGASSGIGRAVARELGARGWAVALIARRAGALEETAQGLSRAMVLPGDVTDPALVNSAFDRVVADWGRVDLLFNNAGIFPPAQPLEELSVDTWRAAVDVNLNAMFWCLQAAFRVMKAQNPQGGRIINNGSISAHAPRPMSSPYTTTKHAITGLTKAAALDGRAYGIAVGQIDIGNAASDMTDAMAKGILQPDGSRRPEPVMDVAHVARAVAHMADLPLDANVLFQTIMATNMPFVGRG
jgi:NAD(P)-dependent dehydrogenase (short-subunit alcohol dehydrogenase family)